MSESALTMSGVVGFIQENTDTNDLDTVIESVRTRRKLLRDQAAAAVKEGMTITIYDVSPKYLAGLRDTVKSIDRLSRKPSAVVTLDQESTTTLAFSSMKYASLANKDSFDLTGVPLSCCKPVA
ncbi:hypothetical protein MOQ72_27200 [Saccharopolyspora sp. K220]|uniref:hypothetical protein n=1 Tax=Saccharopolyspora soli TaxID=2926618 RepID=UPI001F5A9E46|nr:hypothetical protein [Saccharopolyspora soli]MCI2421136.1 hypothetical protein [Saccharopolyspora soli]